MSISFLLLPRPSGRLCLLGGFIVGLVLVPESPSVAASDSMLPGGVAASGLGFVRPDSWAVGRSEIVNHGEQDRDLLLAVSFDPTPHVQYTWPVWVPARSRREVIIPLRAQEVSNEREIGAKALLLDPKQVAPLVENRGLMRVDKGRPTTAMIRDSEDNSSAEVATAIRLAGRLPRRIFYMRDRTVPPVFIGWEALDNIVLARDRPELDASQLAAFRQWIVSGGQLWVMAEQVDPLFMAKLLGEDWTLQIVDHIELNRVTFVGGRRKRDGEVPEVEIPEFEVPVDMARVYAPDWEVTHKVRGWPASLHKRFGLGSVMVTTVGPRAWYWIDWRHNEKHKSMEKFETAWPPLEDLKASFNHNYREPPLPFDELAEFASLQIGYGTLGRQWVGWMFGLYAAGFAGIGVVMYRKQRLEHAAWAGMLLAVVASLTLVAVGMAHQGKVSLTIAEAQVAQVMPEQQHAIVNGSLAIYSPASKKGPLTAARGGVVWPDLARQRGEQLRLQWNDVDRWVWDGLVLPQGAILRAEFRHTVELSEQTGVVVRFGPEGASGQMLRGPFTNLEDAALVTSHAAFAVAIEEDGTFTTQPLQKGQYVAAATLSTVQMRRQDLYRQLLDDKARRKHYPQVATLFAWADPFPLGFSLPQEHELKATTLLAIPIKFETAEPGDRVTVPAGFISYTPTRSPSGEGSSTIYDRVRDEWIAVANGSMVALRFNVPPSVLPLDIDGGTWTIDINAPGRPLEAFFARGDELILLGKTQNKIGQWQVPLPVDAALRAEGDSGVLLALRVGETGRGTGQWRIRSFALEVTGLVGNRN